MTDPFTISIDPARNLVRVVMRGHWTLGTIDAYEQALMVAGAAMRDAGVRREDFLALVDARDGGPQSQEVVTQYRERLGRKEMLPRRLATLVSSALLKRQVDRIAIPNQRLFTDEAEAIAWLLSPDPVA